MINSYNNLETNVRNLYSEKNLEILNNMKNFLNDSSTKKFYINNKSFENGTLRIKIPGIYILTENINFSPNKNVESSQNCEDLKNVLDNFHPKYPDQINDYPKPPYQFGFFAAITIECDNVIIDLNNKTLKQSNMHYYHQRFYSNIELNESPFIAGQGPSNFGDIQYPSNIWIKNGTIGLSSHHGIHGNGNKNILLENLIIKDYEVAGIALNGSDNVICRNIEIKDSSKIVDINFLYSNALYTRRFLYELWQHNPNASLNINGNTNKSIKTIICELQMEMIEKVYKLILENKKPISQLFTNNTKLPEGNIYGIVFNGLGVVVGDFLKNMEGVIGNKNIVVHDILFENLDSFPREIITMTDKKKPHLGTVGNTMPYLDIHDKNSGYYLPNPMTNATVILAKYINIDSSFNIASKSLNIPQIMIEGWFESQKNLIDIKNENSLYFVNLRDQMNHVMKGNLILFISGGSNIKIDNVIMKNILNSGSDCDCNINRLNDYKYIYETNDFINYNLHKKKYLGNDIVPILITASIDIDINNVYCTNVTSLKGGCVGIRTIGNCDNIDTNNISFNEVDYYKNINRLTGYNIGLYNGLIENEKALFSLVNKKNLTKLELKEIINKNRKRISDVMKNINKDIIKFVNEKIVS